MVLGLQFAPVRIQMCLKRYDFLTDEAADLLYDQPLLIRYSQVQF